MVYSIIKLMRPHQYVKNLFIFMPLFFGLKLTDISLVIKSFYAFAAFSLIASSVYIINDYRDIENDKKHPEKKHRPLASGKVSKPIAITVMIIILFMGLTTAYLTNILTVYIILIYLFLNILYTLKLKQIALIDIIIIASGFVLRLYAGSTATGIELSLWIIVMTFLLAKFLGLAKRRDDVIIYLETETKTRKVIDGYNLDFLNLAMTIMATIVIIAYIMYTISPEVMKHIGSKHLYITVIWVILGIMRYFQLTLVFNKSGNPTKILLRDFPTQLILAGWIITFGLIIYL